MSKTLKIVIWLIVIVIVIAIGASLSRKGGDTGTGPIKIGIIAPLTGDGAVYGEPARNVYQLAVEEINAAGGVSGRMIELIIEDGKCNGKDGASAMQKLVNVDKVQVVIGGICSSETLAAIPVGEPQKVVLFSPAASSPDLTGKSAYFFRNYPSDASQGKVLAELAWNEKKWKTVVFIQEQLDYPLGIYKAFSATFEALGGTVTKEEFPSATTDFRSTITKIKGQNPDAVFVDTQAPAAADRILKQMKELKWSKPILVNDATAGDPKTISDNQAILEGALTAEFGIDPANPKFQALLAAYKTKYGTDLPYQSYGQTEYDAIYMIKDAIMTVGLNGEKIATWSRTVKDWDGASGMITIGADGDRVSGHVAKVIKNGKVELYSQ